MILFVLFGQRKEKYKGQYGLEALAVMTEYDMDANSEYMEEQLEKQEKTSDFDGLKIVKIYVNEEKIYSILFPEQKSIVGVIQEERMEGGLK